MPIYEYACPQGHRIERFRKVGARHQKPAGSPCLVCGGTLRLAISTPHIVPDGVYSYAPNIGSADAFERRREAIKAGKKVIPKIEG